MINIEYTIRWSPNLILKFNWHLKNNSEFYLKFMFKVLHYFYSIDCNMSKLNFSKNLRHTPFIFNRICIFLETFNTTPSDQHDDHLVDICPGGHPLHSPAPHLGPPLGLGRPRGLHWDHSRRCGAAALQLPLQMCAYLCYHIIMIIYL